MTDRKSLGKQRDEARRDEEIRNAVPRQSGRRELQVGLFVLLGIAATISVLYIATDPGTFRGRYKVSTLVEEAGGLRKGDPVQLRGVNIGQVVQFALSPNEGVEVVFEVEEQWSIPVGSTTRLVSLGLLGGRIVDIIPGDGPGVLTAGARLPGTMARDIMEAADEVGVKVEATLQRMETLLSESTVSSVRGSVEELHALLASLSTLVEAERDKVVRFTESLNRSAADLEEIAANEPRITRAIARGDSVLGRLMRTSTTLDKTLGSLETILGRLERGEGTLGRLSTDDSLYANLNRALENISLLATDLREHPDRYVKIEIF